MHELVAKAEPKLNRAVEFLAEELKGMRSGRASPALVENIPVEAYSQTMTLKQVASITTPDAKSLTVTPWDPATLAAIEKALREAKELDLNPVNDGKSLHINMPPLTTERREQLAKQVAGHVEQCYISLRNIRHEVLNEAKRAEKDKDIGEDEYHLIDKEIGAAIDNLRKRVEEMAEVKSAEIREV